MAHEAKLEIYKIKLIDKDKEQPRPTFRGFLRPHLDYSNLTAPYSAHDILNVFHKDFIKKIDLETYNKNEAIKKGFTLAYEGDGDQRKSRISPPPGETGIISGILDGGGYGKKRNMGHIENRAQRSEIGIKNIVSDLFYFLLWTPLDGDTGILMVQGYSEMKISDVFKSHIKEYFKIDKKTCEFEYFITEAFKNKFLNPALLKSFKFSTGWLINGNFNEDLPAEYNLDIKIEITDKNPELSKVPYTKLQSILQTFGEGLIQLGGDRTKKLKDFNKKNAKVSSNGKELNLKIDDEYEVRPIILLKDEGVENHPDGSLDFIGIDKYCRDTLAEIQIEIDPSNAVKDITDIR